ncbi:MAG: DUF4114 domain-containing protein [Bacteroidota bacterium]
MKKIFYALIFCAVALSAQSQYQYLGTYDAQGVPDYLEGWDDISEQLLANVGASLPEGKPVPTFNPHLISAGYDNDIRLIDSADVWVTFVGEGAGYRNVLGFYTYDLDYPYTSSPPEDEITIIFPNVSAQGSGGGLVAGDKVKIGTFPANTGIGWVLIANGWKGAVTNGNWVLFSNPDFNMESDPAERFHNVLLNDAENDLIVLGFEDIRRDYASCDQDFNDALFYVTANPITAIERENFAEIVEATEVSSGNDGGLESNGDLASSIAKRNYLRAGNVTVQNKKSRQIGFSRYKIAKHGRKASLEKYFPAQGALGEEEVYVSSPTDLLELTNAKEVFSADYYIGESRVAAALVIATDGKVYSHNKHICDRLNGSKVLEARYVQLEGQPIIYVKIVRDNGDIEHAAWFSAKELAASYEILSLWNIDDYPDGDYLNFQTWGSSPAQVFGTLSHILQEMSAEKTMEKTEMSTELPELIVTQGSYSAKKLSLEIFNPKGLTVATLKANYSETEQSPRYDVEFSLALTGVRYETVQVEIGTIFDAGISLITADDKNHDALYLADGAWGIDYNPDKSAVVRFDLASGSYNALKEEHLVERNFEVAGESNDVVNVFRNILAGNRTLDISAYTSLSFEMKSATDIEISLIEEGLVDWNDRLTAVVSVTEDYQEQIVPLINFRRNGEGISEIGKVRAIVFSYVNKSGNREAFSFGARNTTFGRKELVTAVEADDLQNVPFKLYPNPAMDQLKLVIEQERVDKLELYNTRGQKVLERLNLLTQEGIRLDVGPGLYKVIVHAAGGRQQASLLVE